MEKSCLLIMILALIILLIVFLTYQSKGLNRAYHSEVDNALAKEKKKDNSRLTMDDIKHLPKPVQMYLNYVGAMGKEKVHNVKLRFDGLMNTDKKKDRWSKISVEQYNFFDQTSRYFYMKGSKSGLPFLGLHVYGGGGASMLVKALGLVPVLDLKNEEMVKAETVTVLNDMCLFAPAALIDPRIQWATIDPLTVNATFTNNGIEASAVLSFNEKGELLNFVSDDRYRLAANGSLIKERWSTPVNSYKVVDGIKTIGKTDDSWKTDNTGAFWHTPEGDYCYIKLNVIDIQYNVK
ncbi:hypothetical protein Desor_3656 [Desulfosporosinus orientis DSM 765]|uniref:Uncharacterized protein n=1 Tax=Desulfosporosinus orientis (strain ATCC 19365 / DSM 765 / NCIMB 8382 / VKM B-1628 / Singapore I) TaxID=768706 RepID=G7WIR0_DESOD|nr:DUF6544 family protein [Desulfosporosinus orientis]AET69134.1 hypothetical protein Desor_3656 [Desulfosporosinus orientis DSM 765]